MRRQRTEPKAIEKILDGALRRFRSRSKDLRTGARIMRQWQDIMGEWMSNYCHPISVVGTHLKIGVTSSVWMAEVEYLKQSLLDRMTTVLGPKVIETVSFRLIPEPPPLPLNHDHNHEGSRSPARIPSPVQEAALEKALIHIRDPQLRELIERVLRKAISRSRTQS